MVRVHLKGHFCVARHACDHWRAESKAGRRRRRAHHQHELGRRAPGQRRPERLLGRQGRHRGAHPGAGGGARALRRHRERDRALGAHAHDRGRVRGHDEGARGRLRRDGAGERVAARRLARQRRSRARSRGRCSRWRAARSAWPTAGARGRASTRARASRPTRSAPWCATCSRRRCRPRRCTGPSGPRGRQRPARRETRNVRFAFTEEQEELRATARAFLAEHSGSERVRAAMESEPGFDAEVWKRIGEELGWTAVAIPEAHGGLGLGAVELSALLEPMGEALLCAPFFATVCLGAQALLEAGSEAQRAEHLPGIAGGRTIATLAWTGPSGRPGAEGVERWRGARPGRAATSCSRASLPHVLDGHCRGSPRGGGARAGEHGRGGREPLRAAGAGARARAPRAPDPRPHAAPRRARAARRARAGGGAPRRGGRRGARRSSAPSTAPPSALAAEQVGGAQRCLDLAVAYAKERVQFGRPIGSFQAIKHRLAEMMVQRRDGALRGLLGGGRRRARRRGASRSRVPREGVVLGGVLPLRRRVPPGARRRRLHLGVRRAPLPEARARRRGLPRRAGLAPRARRAAARALRERSHRPRRAGGDRDRRRARRRARHQRALPRGRAPTVVVCSRTRPESLPGERRGRGGLRRVRRARARADRARGGRRCVARFGRLDVLVNNAGGSPYAEAATASPRFSESIVRLNLLAPLHFAQQANARDAGAGRGRLDRQRRERERDAALAGHRRLRGREGGAPRAHADARRRVGAEGARQRGHRGPDPHRAGAAPLRRRGGHRGGGRDDAARAHGRAARRRRRLPVPGLARSRAT